MSEPRLGKRHVITAFAVGSVCLATDAAAWRNPLESRYTNGEPLSICDQGAFFVGGVPKVTAYASPSTGGAEPNYEQTSSARCTCSSRSRPIAAAGPSS